MMSIKSYSFYYKLRTLLFIKEIWLFGSRAKNLARERSDIDLAIQCPQATEEEWQKVMEIIENNDTLLKIDCIRFDTLKDDRLRQEIETTKHVLFKRVENSYGWYETFLDLGEALDRFLEIINLDPKIYPYTVEATIKAFEYSFELYWKLLKKICLDEGLEVNSPRTTLQQSYALTLIHNEKAWLSMLEDRNLTSHTYQQPTANAIYEKCKFHIQTMTKDFAALKERFRL
jgi:nucleotidyltransferase substrate binding protein (TIGR01987 family)